MAIVIIKDYLVCHEVEYSGRKDPIFADCDRFLEKKSISRTKISYPGRKPVSSIQVLESYIIPIAILKDFFGISS